MKFCSISIHAPIVGCDFASHSNITAFEIFQSTHPSWGATSQHQFRDHLSLISIHAPIVGCDCIFLCQSEKNQNFNPRTHRGVRLLINVHASDVKENFNPRTHRGVRQSQHQFRDHLSLISIHAPIVGCDFGSYS